MFNTCKKCGKIAEFVKRKSIEDLKGRIDITCNDCVKHYEIAKALNFDLIYNSEDKHIIGVCIKD